MISKTCKNYCYEDLSLIENYDIAINSNKMYDIHHKNGLKYSKKELQDLNLYYNRPANEHRYTPEQIKHISDGTKIAMQRPEVREKLLKFIESRDFAGNKNPAYGRKWMNNGKITIYPLPEEFDYYLSLGFVFGSLYKKEGFTHTEETKHIFSLQRTGRKWVHKDNEQKFVKPEEINKYLSLGYTLGRK